MRATAKEKFMKRIHKMFTALCAAIAAVVLAISFAACGNATGTYKFSSMEVDMGGMKVSVTAGEAFMGMTITEDAFVLELKDDNTWTMSVNFGGSADVTEGEWSAEGSTVTLTDDSGVSQSGKLDGKNFILSSDVEGMSASITFTKQ